MSGSVSAAAEAILVARASLSQIPRISETFGIADAAAAYEVQRITPNDTLPRVAGSSAARSA
jgi:2-keto-4-pentenoate hydratase